MEIAIIEPHSKPSPSWKSTLALPAFIAACFLPSLLGAWFMPDAWFKDLHKPSWNPPGWLFGPVWTFLYLSMGVAAWMVWRKCGFKDRVWWIAFAAQLAVNTIWTPVFFGMHLPGAALAVIVSLWLLIVATILLFWRRDRSAALLLTPYLCWVSFASFLNYTIWQLN